MSESFYIMVVISLGSASQKALVAADPFQPSSPMLCIGFTGGMKGPFDLATTAIGIAKPVEDTVRGTESLVQSITDRLDVGVDITASC